MSLATKRDVALVNAQIRKLVRAIEKPATLAGALEVQLHANIKRLKRDMNAAKRMLTKKPQKRARK